MDGPLTAEKLNEVEGIIQKREVQVFNVIGRLRMA